MDLHTDSIDPLQVLTTSGLMQGIRLRASGDEDDPENEAVKSPRKLPTFPTPPAMSTGGKAPKRGNKVLRRLKAQRKRQRMIMKYALQVDPQVAVYRNEFFVDTSRAHAEAGAEQFVRTWRGVPYGEDTSGVHRFRAPRPYRFRPGVRDCSRYGEPALQPSMQPSFQGRDATMGSEDCLNLDIVRPDTDALLPVVVYFHGGSFFMGVSHAPLLRGHRFSCEMQAVYVGVNFRLGALGYLDMRSISDDCVANPALLDQLLALRWVQHNIANFGGDPNNVTLMGESAGGAAALTLMCVPAAQGLFHRVIAQSPAIAAVHTREQSVFWAQRLARRLKLGDHPTLRQIRECEGSDIVRAGQSMMWRAGQLLSLNMSFATTVDHLVLHDHPLAIFQRGEQLKVPLLVGTNVDEAAMLQGFYVRQEARAQAAQRILRAYDPERADEVFAAYNGVQTRKDYAQLLGDAIFWAPTVMAAQAHSDVEPTWMYRFDFASVLFKFLGFGAMHTMELTPIFGDYTAARTAVTQWGTRQDLIALGEIMQGYWRRFIWAGDPGGEWPRYHRAADKDPGRATYIFDRTPHVVYDPQAQYRKVWENFELTNWAHRRQSIFEQVRAIVWPQVTPAASDNVETLRTSFEAELLSAVIPSTVGEE
ncbi:MAG: carboxylesterase/lipase family protein [Corynebacterium sp.]|nr:carboxylesterase/lipase family protein [Corynebacterium sp.]